MPYIASTAVEFLEKKCTLYNCVFEPFWWMPSLSIDTCTLELFSSICFDWLFKWSTCFLSLRSLCSAWWKWAKFNKLSLWRCEQFQIKQFNLFSLVYLPNGFIIRVFYLPIPTLRDNCESLYRAFNAKPVTTGNWACVAIVLFFLRPRQSCCLGCCRCRFRCEL